MSVHLDYDEPVLGYHRILAGLVAAQAPPAAAVLDVGCGPGQLLQCLAELRPDLHLTGVDGDPECLRRAAQRCPSAELVVDDITDLGQLTTSSGPDPESWPGFQLVVSSHSLEHLPHPVQALDRWAGLLNPDGRLIVAVPNSLQPPLLGRAAIRRTAVNGGHFYIWDRATFENFCRLAGFRIVERAVDYVPLVPVRWRRRLPMVARLERWLLTLAPQFSNSHIVVLAPEPAT